MGYTLELWGLPVRRLLDELRAPVLGADSARDHAAPHVLERWQALAQEVSAILASGGEVGGDRALYVVAVVRTLGEHMEALDHTSSGGDEFRELLDGPAARRLGRDLIDHLLGRPLEDLTWAEYPSIGWASTGELRRAADRMAPPAGEEDDPFEILRNLELTVRIAAHTGRDIVSIYL